MNLTFNEYLSQLPKSQLRSFAPQQGSAKLVATSNLLQEIQAVYSRPDSVALLFNALGSTAKQFIQLLFWAGDPGMTGKEILESGVFTSQKQMNSAKYETLKSLLAYGTLGENDRYLLFPGFRLMLEKPILEEVRQKLKMPAPEERALVINHHPYFTIGLLGSVLMGEGKPRARRSPLRLAEDYLRKLPLGFNPAVLAEEEIHSLFASNLDFFMQQGLVDGGKLFLNLPGREWFAKHATEQWPELFTWARKDISGPLASWLKLLETSARPVSLAGMVLNKKITRATRWAGLPDLVRIACARGAVSLTLSREMAGTAMITPYGRSLLSGICPPVPEEKDFFTCTPGFEILLPPEAGPRIRFWLAMFAEPIAVDIVTTYRLSKSSFISGLQKGVTPLTAIQFLEEHAVTPPGLPQNIRFHLQEWAGYFEHVEFSRPVVMRIKDASLQDRLHAVLRAQGLISESLPGFGFILDPGQYAGALKVVSQMGYIPRELSEEDLPVESEPAVAPPEKFPAIGRFRPVEVKLAAAPAGEAIISPWEKDSSSFAFTNWKKYSGEFITPDRLELQHVINYAILTEQQLELIYLSLEGVEKNIVFQPQEIARDRNEPAVYGSELNGAGRLLLEIERIRKIRILER